MINQPANTIMTVEGSYFDFDHPEQSSFTIETVAHALSNLCRYTGHTREFYSVAQHCVYVSHIVPEHLALQGLLHDAGEAFINDVARPLKNMLPDYRIIEHRVEKAVFERLGIPVEIAPEVHHADLVMLATEKRDLMPGNSTRWALLDGIPMLDMEIEPVLPRQAYRLFMDRYEELTKYDAAVEHVGKLINRS